MTKEEDQKLFNIEEAFLDVELIAEGKWLPLGTDFPNAEILARGLSSPGAKKLRAHLERTAPKQDRLSSGQLTQEARDRIIRITVARECIMDWRGIGSGGKPLPFKVETAESLLTEPRAIRIATAFVNAIVDLENTTSANAQAVLGN